MTNKKMFFVAGTDTGVGKTSISCALLQAAKNRNLSTCGLKPIASGCELIDGLWRNEDALALQKVATYPLDYQGVNPIALPQAIAPHIAAQKNNRVLSVNSIVQHCQSIARLPVDFTLVEGAGGWFVPVNQQETLADFVLALNIPVILVVGVRLGCINHALLTQHAIATEGLTLDGWVANCVDEHTDCEREIIDSLESRIQAPCLGKVPYTHDATHAPTLSTHLDISFLLNS